jgi:hypothetical protein
VNPDQRVDVYRPEEEVLAKTALVSFEGKSVTSPHPPEFLNPTNDRGYSLGHAQNIRAGERLGSGEVSMIGDLVIKDGTLINQIESGSIKELSAGYTYDLDLMPDGRYAMRGICGNHIAVVAHARGGSELRILDSQTEEEVAMDVKEATGFFAGLKDFFSSAGLKLVAQDASPDDAVKRNEEVNSKALERARSRNEDELKTKDAEKDKEMEKEDKGAEKPDKKEEKGSDAALKAKDAQIDRLLTLVDRLTARDAEKEEKEEKKDEKKSEDAKECSCDAEEGEPHGKGCPMFKEKDVEDSELTPVLTLAESERPKNPIPGADAAQIARKAAMDELKRLRPVIAACDDDEVRKAFDERVKFLRGATKGLDGYSKITTAASRKSNDAKKAEDESTANRGQELVSMADQYLGKDPSTVNVERTH